MDVSHGTWHLKYMVSGGKARFDARSQSVKILPNLKASYEEDLRVFPSLTTILKAYVTLPVMELC